MPVALGLHEQVQDETKDRQGSAPITRQEKDSHRKRLSSVEQERLTKSSSSNRTSSWTASEDSNYNSKRQSTD